MNIIMAGFNRVICNNNGRIIYSSRVKDNRALGSLDKIREGWKRISGRIGGMLSVLIERIKLLKLEIKGKGCSEKPSIGIDGPRKERNELEKKLTKLKGKFVQATGVGREKDLEQKLAVADSATRESKIEISNLRKEKLQLERKLIKLQAENEEVIKTTDELKREFNQKVMKLESDLAVLGEEKQRKEKNCDAQLKTIRQLKEDLLESEAELVAEEKVNESLGQEVHALRRQLGNLTVGDGGRVKKKKQINLIQKQRKTVNEDDAALSRIAGKMDGYRKAWEALASLRT